MSTWHQVDKLVARRKRAAVNGSSNVPLKKKKQPASKVDMDIWSASIDADVAPIEDDMNDFIEPIIRKKAVLRGATKTLPVSGFKAVNPVGHGLSYNPRFSDHQKSIQLAIDQELELQAAAERIAKRLSYPAELDELVCFMTYVLLLG
jgi:hypothetical protein